LRYVDNGPNKHVDEEYQDTGQGGRVLRLLGLLRALHEEHYEVSYEADAKEEPDVGQPLCPKVNIFSLSSFI